ncbi:MAG: hypothetical protein HKL82_12160 [Acidimicrobiaceae bacterium]|nr:hypothetical protein [Acidimicrobiaceae bacterium]
MNFRSVSGILGTVLALGVALSACGSSGSSSPTTSVAKKSSGSKSSSSSTTLASTTTSTTAATVSAFPSLAQLESSSNYAYSLTTVNGATTFRTTGIVSAPNAFEFKVGGSTSYTVIYHGTSYTISNGQVISAPVGPSAQVPPLVGFASQVNGVATNSASFATQQGGSCSQGGISGNLWTIHTNNVPANLGQTYTVCTQSSTGLLLSVSYSAQVGSATTQTLEQQFELTAVGNQPAVTPPTVG